MSHSRIQGSLLLCNNRPKKEYHFLPPLVRNSDDESKKINAAVNKIIKHIDEHLTKLQAHREELLSSKLPKISKPFNKISDLGSQINFVKKRTIALFERIDNMNGNKFIVQTKKPTPEENNAFLNLIETTEYQKIKAQIEKGHGLHERTKNEDTSLIVAIKKYAQCYKGSRDHLDAQRIIIDLCNLAASHPDYINQQNSFGNTALHYAVSLNEKWLVDLLLTCHANATIENNRGLNPYELGQERHKNNYDSDIVIALRKQSIFKMKPGLPNLKIQQPNCSFTPK